MLVDAWTLAVRDGGSGEGGSTPSYNVYLHALETDHSHNIVVLGVTWALTSIAILFTLVRLATRKWIVKQLYWDDLFMALALVSSPPATDSATLISCNR